MSRPRNNLDELQRKHTLPVPPSPTKPATPQPNGNKSKFKPAKSIPASSTPVNVTVRKLSSFSTPGFGKAKPPLGFPSVADNNLSESYVDVSSTETTPLNASSSSIPIKRLSDGSSDDLIPHTSPKRHKTNHLPDKENFFHVDFTAKGKARARDPPRPTAQPASAHQVLPSPQINISPPSLLTASPPTLQAAFEALTHDIDLREKNEKELRAVCDTAQDLIEACDKLIGLTRTDPSETKDIALLAVLQDYFERRMAASRAELKAIQRGERPSAARGLGVQSNMASGSSMAPVDGSSHWHSNPLGPSASGDVSRVSTPARYVPPASPSNAVNPWDIDEDYWSSFIDPDDPIDLTNEPEPPANIPATPPATQPRPLPPIQVAPPAPPPAHLLKRDYFPEVMKVLNNVFGLKEFRPKQLDAICAAMDGRDVFVLFPTGSGKSLTFQIPAVCQDGTTVVVCPLVSLMRDQVDALKKLKIDVAQMSGDITEDEKQLVRQRFRSGNKPKLLYVTPEQVQVGGWTKTTLQSLYERGQLMRFVIDEAHCISDWGRRFRDSYAQLTELRKVYPKVPISALTATANAEVESDIILRLNIPQCARFKLSFNRTNLDYEVRPKKTAKACIGEIAVFIRDNHPRDTGIIYCHSRANCEDVAKELREKHGLNAKHYHAQMDQGDKMRAQREWSEGDVHIIVATVAFGMGIDKPDVRYVIHYSLPATLASYYQETGRGGRDGKLSKCILYFTWGDAFTRLDMIRKEDKPDEEKRWQEEDVWAVARYCSNDVRCRRQQVLGFFGEEFDPLQCHELCNNCRDKTPVTSADHTQEALNAMQLFESLSRKGARLTRGQLISAIKGSKLKAMLEKGFDRDPLYGACKHLTQAIAERLVDEMLFTGILTNEQVQTGEYTQSYLQLSHNAHELRSRKRTLEIEFRVTQTRKDSGKTTATRQRKGRGKPAQDCVVELTSASTSVAGPSTASSSRSRRGKTPAVTEDEPGRILSLFRDDPEEYPDYVEDDIEDIPSPPRAPQPRMGTRGMPSASQSLAAGMDSDIEEADDVTPPPPKVTMIRKEDVQDGDAEMACKAELLEIRDQIAAEGNEQLAALLNDEAVEFLAVMLPNDREALKAQLSELGLSIEHLGRWERSVLSACSRFHMHRGRV